MTAPGNSPRFAGTFLAGLLVGVLSVAYVIPENELTGEVTSDSGGFTTAEALDTTETTAGPGGPTVRRVVRGGSGGGSGGSADSGGTGDEDGGQSGAAGAGGGGGGLECRAGANGGSTDVGVSADKIKLGATVAESGIAKDFLGEARHAMDAVKNKFNREGGACGRLIDIVYKNDGWSPDTGRRFLQNLVEDEKVFALAVVPSSEGLNAVSEGGDLLKFGVPVVGSDGMIRTQYTDPFIWPVAAATVTTMHVAMKDAWKRAGCGEPGENPGCDKLHPAIVFENNFRFGVEGALAFNSAYKRLAGKDIPGFVNPLSSTVTCQSRFCGIQGGQGQYGAEVAAINDACNSAPKCNYLMLLLEPKTAQDWMAVTGAKTPGGLELGMGAGQPLFTFNFGRNCGDKCNGLTVWTGYNPPVEQYRTSQAVQTYVDDLHSVSASADEFNQFTQGSYLGMLLLIEAIGKVGPNLTRANLIAALDSMTLDTGLSSKPLTWKKGDHVAQPGAQAFRFESKNGFTGWSFAAEHVSDPWRTSDFG